jgi:hypothetical protein
MSHQIAASGVFFRHMACFSGAQRERVLPAREAEFQGQATEATAIKSSGDEEEIE